MQITATLVGAFARDTESRAAITELEIGDDESLSLEPEPDNEYDPRAVKVIHTEFGYHLGYIPRDSNGPLFEALQNGAEPVVEVIAFESTIKPVLEITWDE